MLKRLATFCGVLTSAILLFPIVASSAPYIFTSGSVELTAVIQGTTTSVLEPGTSPVSILLGGSFVDFDPAAGANGTILGLELIPGANFILDLDAAATGGFDLVEISGAMLVQDAGATGVLSGGGSFSLDTLMTATIAGIGGPPPSTFVSSLTSNAVGLMGISGDTLTLGLFGINIASFESLAEPGTFIDVKADFTFVGVVPEPTTALLLGLGLAGLASVRKP